jgi:hypothetical protein
MPSVIFKYTETAELSFEHLPLRDKKTIVTPSAMNGGKHFEDGKVVRLPAEQGYYQNERQRHKPYNWK